MPHPRKRSHSHIDVTIQLKHPAWKQVLRPYCKTVEHVCDATIAAIAPSKKSYELVIVLAADDFIQQLNHTYRGNDKPTNVLSFSGDGNHLGDVILALETIVREAEAQDKTVRHHAMHLLTHGVLHLFGYDHASPKTAQAMERLEIKILKTLGVDNPYL